MIRPKEKDYTSQVAYTRALEAYCDSLPQLAQYSDIVSDGGMDPRNKFDKPAQQEPAGLLQEIARLHDRIKDLEKDVEFLSLPAQQEPVAWICKGSQHDEKHSIDYWPGDVDDLPVGTKLYTQAQRTWVGLTDEERQEIWKGCDPTHAGYVTALVEAKLKEKNT